MRPPGARRGESFTSLRARCPVTDVTGVGQAFSGDRDPQVVAAGMTLYLTKFATSARVRGLPVTGSLAGHD